MNVQEHDGGSRQRKTSRDREARDALDHARSFECSRRDFAIPLAPIRRLYRAHCAQHRCDEAAYRHEKAECEQPFEQANPSLVQNV